MSIIRKVGWLPPLLELVGAICTFLSLKISEAAWVSTFVQGSGQEKIATVSVSFPALGIVGLLLVGIGLLFQVVIEWIRK
jgi:hypothetical protein